jgi:hypothetical protein
VERTSAVLGCEASHTVEAYVIDSAEYNHHDIHSVACSRLVLALEEKTARSIGPSADMLPAPHSAVHTDTLASDLLNAEVPVEDPQMTT